LTLHILRKNLGCSDTGEHHLPKLWGCSNTQNTDGSTPLQCGGSPGRHYTWAKN